MEVVNVKVDRKALIGILKASEEEIGVLESENDSIKIMLGGRVTRAGPKRREK